MAKAVFTVLLTFFLLTLITKNTQAAKSLTITSDKQSLFGNQEASITIVPSGFTEGETIYLKGAFYQDGSSNYFGYTKNGDNWIKNGETSTSQKQVKIGEWDGILNIKSDFEDSGYTGEGDYKFKIGVYTTKTNGELSSVNWYSNVLNFNINDPDPSPSPSPSSNPASPTNSKSPTPTPAASKSPTPTPTPSQSATPEVLSATDEASPSSKESDNSSSPSPTPKSAENLSKTKIAGLLTGSGILIISLSVGFILWYRQTLNPKEKSKDGNTK